MGMLDNFLSGGVGGAVGGLVSGIFGAIGAKKQYKRQQKLMDKQAQLDRETWMQQFNATNEYNDPSAQLERLEAAGINPLTQDGGFANTSSASPSTGGGAPTPPVPDMSGFGDAFGSATEQLLKERALSQEDSRISNDTQRVMNETKVAVATVDELLSRSALNKDNSALTQENIGLVREKKEEVKANVAYLQGQLQRQWFQNQKDINDMVLSWAEYKVEERYKNGLLTLQGEANEIASFDAETRRQSVKDEMTRFNKTFELEVQKFQKAIEKQDFELIKEALSDIKEETILGVTTGITEGSMARALALLASLSSPKAEAAFKNLSWFNDNENSTVMSTGKHLVELFTDNLGEASDLLPFILMIMATRGAGTANGTLPPPTPKGLPAPGSPKGLPWLKGKLPGPSSPKGLPPARYPKFPEKIPGL